MLRKEDSDSYSISLSPKIDLEEHLSPFFQLSLTFVGADEVAEGSAAVAGIF